MACEGKIHPEGGADEPLSGMSATATWLTLGSLITSLTKSGYTSVHVIDNNLTHVERTGGDDRRHDRLIFRSIYQAYSWASLAR